MEPSPLEGNLDGVDRNMIRLDFTEVRPLMVEVKTYSCFSAYCLSIDYKGADLLDLAID